jgi:hypothetical protein
MRIDADVRIHLVFVIRAYQVIRGSLLLFTRMQRVAFRRNFRLHPGGGTVALRRRLP